MEKSISTIEKNDLTVKKGVLEAKLPVQEAELTDLKTATPAIQAEIEAKKAEKIQVQVAAARDLKQKIEAKGEKIEDWLLKLSPEKRAAIESSLAIIKKEDDYGRRRTLRTKKENKTEEGLAASREEYKKEYLDKLKKLDDANLFSKSGLDKLRHKASQVGSFFGFNSKDKYLENTDEVKGAKGKYVEQKDDFSKNRRAEVLQQRAEAGVEVSDAVKARYDRMTAYLNEKNIVENVRKEHEGIKAAKSEAWKGLPKSYIERNASAAWAGTPDFLKNKYIRGALIGTGYGVAGLFGGGLVGGAVAAGGYGIRFAGGVIGGNVGKKLTNLMDNEDNLRQRLADNAEKSAKFETKYKEGNMAHTDYMEQVKRMHEDNREIEEGLAKTWRATRTDKMEEDLRSGKITPSQYETRMSKLDNGLRGLKRVRQGLTIASAMGGGMFAGHEAAAHGFSKENLVTSKKHLNNENAATRVRAAHSTDGHGHPGKAETDQQVQERLHREAMDEDAHGIHGKTADTASPSSNLEYYDKNVEVSSSGMIQSVKDLQKAVAAEYASHSHVPIPPEVKAFIDGDPTKIAIDNHFYNPADPKESLFMLKGSHLGFEHGKIVTHALSDKTWYEHAGGNAAPNGADHHFDKTLDRHGNPLHGNHENHFEKNFDRHNHRLDQHGNQAPAVNTAETHIASNGTPKINPSDLLNQPIISPSGVPENQLEQWMKDHPGAPRPPTIGNYGTTGNYGYQAEAPVGVTDYPIKNVPFIDADYGFSTDNIFFNGRLSPVQWEQMQYADATHQFQESFSPAGMGHSMANFYRSIEDIARRTGMHPHTSPIYGPENYRDFIHRVRVHVGRR